MIIIIFQNRTSQEPKENITKKIESTYYLGMHSRNIYLHSTIYVKIKMIRAV